MSNVIQDITRTIKNWWLFLVLGIIMLAFSIWIWYTPLESYVGLAWAFNILVFANGVSNVFFSISNHKNLEGWGWFLASGILEMIIGLILIIYPGISITSLPFIIGFWVMIKSGFIVGTAIDLKRYGFQGWGWLFAFGILLTITSFFMILHPVFGVLSIVGWTSLASIFFGITYITLAMKLKKLKNTSIDKIDKLKSRIINHYELEVP